MKRNWMKKTIIGMMGCMNLVCLALTSAQELYFEPRITSGTFCEEIRAQVYNAEIDWSVWYSWDISEVEDFSQDGALDVLFSIYYFGPHGNTFPELILEKGNRVGRNQTWRRWKAYRVPPGLGFLVSDWDHDGDEDLAYSLNDFSNTNVQLALFSGDTILDATAFLHEIKHLSTLEYSYPGDFDGDGLNDILAYSQTLLGEGNLSFLPIETTIPLQFLHPNLHEFCFLNTCDLNEDRADDVLYWYKDKIHVYLGNSNREKLFSASQTYEMPMKVSGVNVVKKSSGEESEMYIHSATEVVRISNDREGNLQFDPLLISRYFTPSQFVAGDLNQDDNTDLLSWNENMIYVFMGDRDHEFHYSQSIYVPVGAIYKLFLRDDNHDGRMDIVMFDTQAAMAIYDQTDGPSTIPTPTPSLPVTIFPTPTPIPARDNVILVTPDMNLDEMMLNAPDDSMIQLEPGKYRSMNGSMKVLFQHISNKKFSLFGMDPQNPPVLLSILVLNDSQITLQNLDFERNLGHPWGFIYIENSDMTMIHCIVRGSSAAISAYSGGDLIPGDKTVFIQRSTNHTITMIDNQIDAGSLNTNILVQNCTDTVLDLRKNPMLGWENRIAHVQIEDCTRVTVLLEEVDNPYEPRSLTTLSVYRSSVNVNGGVIRGYDGLPGVVGEDGGVGILANEGSVVVLEDTLVYGGRGGDGIQFGAEGQAILTDASSSVITQSPVPDWSLHE